MVKNRGYIQNGETVEITSFCQLQPKAESIIHKKGSSKKATVDKNAAQPNNQFSAKNQYEQRT